MLSNALTQADIKVLGVVAFFIVASFLNGDILFGILFILLFIGFLTVSILVELRERKRDEHRKYRKKYYNRL